jgi:hypothetical protein
MQHRDEFGVPTIRSSIAMSLFGFGLALGVVLRPLGVFSYIKAAVRGVDETGETLPAAWQFMYQALVAPLVIESVLFIVTAWFYFNRRKVARPLVIVAILVAIANTIVETAWSVVLAEGDAEYIARTVGPAVPACLVALAWVIYFLRSQRVRATLVYPIVRE